MKAIRGLKRALNDNGRFRYKAPELCVDHVVVGGGVVGLAVAQRLCRAYPDKTTYLIERHGRVGEEISSRNSEVIHSGLYYPEDSWKTSLCIRGRDLLYQRCKDHGVPFRQTGKLVVAKEDQLPYIENLFHKSSQLQWPKYLQELAAQGPSLPTELISGDQAREMEPDLSAGIAGALWVPATGIVDSHALMQGLEQEILQSDNGQIACATRLVRLDPYDPSKRPADIPDTEPVESGWVLQLKTGDTEETDSIMARTVINAAGLSSTFVLNSLLPQDKRITMYFAKGSYASYRGPGTEKVSHLIYPCPEAGPNQHAFQSLGTHLTLDLDGKIRFGPDLQWISPPDVLAAEPEDDVDFWMAHLTPDEGQLPEMHRAVQSYLSGVTLAGLRPDYCGIRPKLVPPGGGFQDFIFRVDHPTKTLSDFRPMVSLLGVESPGLTASLAIAEHVVTQVLYPEDRIV